MLVRSFLSPLKVLYNPQAFFTHAASLDQGFPHCPIFPTAASRRTYAVLANLSAGYSPLLGRFRSITHPFAARQHVLLRLLPLDLHVLGTPPAFNLSQDQTLHLKILRINKKE